MMEAATTIALDSTDTQNVLMFGSSMVQAGFSPLQFDAYYANKHSKVRSYNFGIANMNPEFQQYLTRHIRTEFEASGKKLRLAVVEFNPFQTTKTRDQLGAVMRDQSEAVLLPVQDLVAMLWRDPNRALRLLNIRFFRDGLSAELISSEFVLGNALRRTFQDTLPEGSKPFKSGWNKEIRGARMDKRGLSDESIARMDEYLQLAYFIGERSTKSD